MWQQYGDAVEFVVVYIREAHPEDGWVITMNRDQDIALDDPTTNEERHEVATTCALRLKIRMPVVIDEIDDKIASAYGALPDRLYLVARGGKIAFQGAPVFDHCGMTEIGPWGFEPARLEEAILKL